MRKIIRERKEIANIAGENEKDYTRKKIRRARKSKNERQKEKKRKKYKRKE